MNQNLLEELRKVPILCVEDEDGIREVIVNTLKYYFDEVYEASNAKDAFDLYEEYKPKIILSDIQMKKTNGINLVRQIRKHDMQTTIIMLTAYCNEEYLMDLINLNINHYILKPLNHKKLTEALLKYVQKHVTQKLSLAQELYLDLATRSLLYKNDTIPLRKREKEFLQLLYEHKNQIVTYAIIEDELWGDKFMTNHALKSFIKELRAKLPLNIIKNVPQEGYTLL
ncbi:response regulator transcription factor [Candidatus Marinarcus aquaticus]|uniref:DNA-binding response regulator n=1 Tax=Candidatus Marinarcus aquaticus TaxID=2044504 RepID=A0A4Q0XWT5_9BACT|nr:response regulator transcription factor [Candidatus Marinarcus aquaticus]RXJ60739.1 DNA-binding response regulator [Candidatus Marinarcus aquaticus]